LSGAYTRHGSVSSSKEGRAGQMGRVRQVGRVGHKMRFAIVGAGAVGGYFGAKLARAGHEVTLFARGAHLNAIRERGLEIKSPLGDFVVRLPAENDPARVPPVDVAIFAVKTYSNRDALPILKKIVHNDTRSVDSRGADDRPSANTTVALTLQNGVDSVGEVAAVVGQEHVLGGATFVATAITRPGVIEQTGLYRRILFGESFGDRARISPRVEAIARVFAESDIGSEPVTDARVPIWEKFCYLAPFASFTGAGRLPIGPLWSDPVVRDRMKAAIGEVETVALAEGVPISSGMVDRVATYLDTVPPTTRSSLLTDLLQGNPIEVDALIGSLVRRGKALGISTPHLGALYAVLKPHEHGRVDRAQAAMAPDDSLKA
jgi:2-dehydropantoate 2-reductase